MKREFVAIVAAAGAETQKPLTKAEVVSPPHWVCPAIRCAMALAPEEWKLRSLLAFLFGSANSANSASIGISGAP
jgi:hypothetical protein